MSKKKRCVNNSGTTFALQNVAENPLLSTIDPSVLLLIASLVFLVWCHINFIRNLGRQITHTPFFRSMESNKRLWFMNQSLLTFR